MRVWDKVLLLVAWVWLMLPSKHVLWRHAATGTLVPDKSTGIPRQTTPHQGCVLLRMVPQDRFISAQALTAQMRNLYGMRTGRKTINNELLSHGYRTYKPTRKTCWLSTTAISAWCGAQRWQNLTMTLWHHAVFSVESRFQLYLVDDRLRVHRLHGELFQQRC